ncbi:MAG: ATP-binding protein, partial [Chloroflexota bacterium]
MKDVELLSLQKFDVQPVYSATLDDLDLELFRYTYLPSAVAHEVIEENNRPIEMQLSSLRNAVLHRTYEATNALIRIFWFSNRIQISSPGGLFGQVTAQNFDTTTDYRNP